MAVPLLDLSAQYNPIGNEIEAAVLQVLRSQNYILGPKVEELEKACADYCGVPHAVGVSSGSDALLMALMALRIGAGDEVITTPFSFFATAGAVDRVGAKTVFVDIDPATFNIDPAAIEAAITPKTKAIIAVHLFGQCAEMDPILEIADRHRIAVIEDAAQAIGSEYRGRRAGSMGAIGCFSFFPSKNLGGVGDGGLVTTTDKDIAARLVKLRNHGSSPKYYHTMVGGNFRLDAIQAVVLSVKLPHLDGWTAGRQANAETYRNALKDLEITGELTVPVTADGRRHIFNQFTLRIPGARDRFRKFMGERGIGTEIYYPLPLHIQECFGHLGYSAGDMPFAEKAALEAVSVPIFPELTAAQIDEVVAAIREFFGR